MKDLSLVQEYMICAVNEKGGIPSFSTEKLVCLVAAGLLDLRLAGCLAIEGKKVQTTSPLPENRAYLGSLYEFVGDKPKALEKIVEAYTYSVTDKRLVRLMEDVGRSLVDLGLAQEARGGLLGNKKNFVPAKTAVESVIDMVRAELLEDGEVTEDIAALVALLEKGKCVKTYFSAYEQKAIREKLKAIAASPEGKLAGELIGCVENMIAIGTGLIAVYS